MELSAWAKQQGIKYHTAWLWVKHGKMPVPFIRTPAGTIIAQEASIGEQAADRIVLCARVSGSDQKADLDRQLARLMEFSQGCGWVVCQAISEVGSGLNGPRPKLMRLLGDPSIKRIVVEHRDRLMRFGSEYVAWSLNAQGRHLTVMDESDVKADLVQDMIEVLTSFAPDYTGDALPGIRPKKAVEALVAEQ